MPFLLESTLFFWFKAKDEYYSGHPVVLDEMFDTVEVRYVIVPLRISFY